MKNYLMILSFAVIAACGFPKEDENPKVETATIDSMHNYLSTLDLRLPESAGSALTYTHTVMQTMNEDRRDSAFILYRQFYYEVLMQQNQMLSQSPLLMEALINENNPRIDELDYYMKKLNDNGMIILQTEGTFYIDEKQDYLHSAFSKYVTDPIKQLLAIRKEEMKKGFSEDGALLISFKEVGERVRNWEKLIEENPSLKLQHEAMGYYNLYLSTFLTGLDNTPVFNPQTNKLLPEVKNVYEEYIQNYGESNSGRIVSRYYTILTQNNLNKPENINQFLSENNIVTMEGVQPPTR